MRAAIAGDATAYRGLLQSLTQSLRAATRRGFAQFGAAMNDVEDVVQETLLAIHLKRHTWDPTQPDEQRSDLDRQDAEKLINELNGRQQMIVRSIGMEGKSIRDVAGTLGMNEGAVRVALHRGLKALAAIHRKGDEE
jgi:RNA polymerase sigma-70 factor (ECF subfamily)